MIRTAAAAFGADTPDVTGPFVQAQWFEARMARDMARGGEVSSGIRGLSGEQNTRALARKAFLEGNHQGAVDRWMSQSEKPRQPADHRMLATAMAKVADDRAPAQVERLREIFPTDAALVEVAHARARKDVAATGAALVAAFELARSDPFFHRPLMEDALALCAALAKQEQALVEPLFEALAQPFAAGVFERARLMARLDLAMSGELSGRCVEALAPFERAVPWKKNLLEARVACYEATGSSLVDAARADAATYRRREAPAMTEGLSVPD